MDYQIIKGKTIKDGMSLYGITDSIHFKGCAFYFTHDHPVIIASDIFEQCSFRTKFSFSGNICARFVNCNFNEGVKAELFKCGDDIPPTIQDEITELVLWFSHSQSTQQIYSAYDEITELVEKLPKLQKLDLTYTNISAINGTILMKETLKEIKYHSAAKEFFSSIKFICTNEAHREATQEEKKIILGDIVNTCFGPKPNNGSVYLWRGGTIDE